MKGEHEVKKAAHEVGDKVREKAQKQVQSMAKRISRGDVTPRDVFGLNDAFVEGLYGQAYRLYNTGKYDDAKQLFRLLIMLNPMEAKYAMGLGACYHMSKEFKDAADTYAICGVLEPKNPIPYFHASDCYMQIGDKLSSIIALEMAVELAGKQPQYAKLKDRAELTLTGLKKGQGKTEVSKKE